MSCEDTQPNLPDWTPSFRQRYPQPLAAITNCANCGKGIDLISIADWVHLDGHDACADGKGYAEPTEEWEMAEMQREAERRAEREYLGDGIFADNH